MDWENHLEQNPTQKIEKTVKIRVKLPHMNKKTTAEIPNFCSNTVFSLYFKFGAKTIHAAKPLAFSLHFLFRRDQNHYSNLTSKIMKMCEQILEKKTAHQYNSNSLNCKKRQLLWVVNTIQILWIVKKNHKPKPYTNPPRASPHFPALTPPILPTHYNTTSTTQK